MATLDTSLALQVPDSLSTFLKDNPLKGQPMPAVGKQDFNALVNSKTTGMPVSQAYDLDKELEEKKKDNRGFLQQTVDTAEQFKFALDKTGLEIQDLEIVYDLMPDPDNPELLERKRKVAAEIRELGKNPRIGTAEKWAGATGSLGRYFYESGWRGVAGAIAAGVPTAGILAASGMGAAVSVPAGIVAAKWGSAASAGYFIYKIETAAAYKEMLEYVDPVTKEKVDPNIAKATAYGVGVLNGLSELVQIRRIIKTIPGGEAILQKSIRETGQKLLKSKAYQSLMARFVRRYGPAVGLNTLQEIQQESVTMMGVELAKNLTNNLKGTNLGGIDPYEVGERIRETAVESAMGFSVIMLPGSVVSAYHSGASKEEIAKLTAPPVIDDTTDAEIQAALGGQVENIEGIKLTEELIMAETEEVVEVEREAKEILTEQEGLLEQMYQVRACMGL